MFKFFKSEGASVQFNTYLKKIEIAYTKEDQLNMLVAESLILLL